MAEKHHEIEGIPLYIGIYVALMILLVATVLAADQNLGAWNGTVSLAIAVAKAVLVILFFMHLRHSHKTTWIFVIASFVWLGILLSLTMTDFATRGTPAPNSRAQIMMNR